LKFLLRSWDAKLNVWSSVKFVDGPELGFKLADWTPRYKLPLVSTDSFQTNGWTKMCLLCTTCDRLEFRTSGAVSPLLF
jgi:hypothetical protein